MGTGRMAIVLSALETLETLIDQWALLNILQWDVTIETFLLEGVAMDFYGIYNVFNELVSRLLL